MKDFISGKKVSLRALSKEDINARYLSWLNDSEINQFMTSGITPNRIEDLEEYYERIKNDRNSIHFAILDKKNKEHIGNVKLEKIDWRNRICEFGILIGDKTYWGKGVATEVTALVVDYAFKKLNLRKVCLGVIKDNIAAVKIYEKVGFEIEGCEKEMFWVEGKYCDSLRMGIFREKNNNGEKYDF